MVQHLRTPNETGVATALRPERVEHGFERGFDDHTPPEELPDLERYLSELRHQSEPTQGAAQARCKPKSETKVPAENKGAA